MAKQAMYHMSDSDDNVDQSNFDATYAMYFFGVPNSGMNINGLKPMVRDQPNEEFIMSLARDSQLLRELHRKFWDKFIYEDSKVVSFFELRKSQSSRQVDLSLLTILAYIDLLVGSRDERVVEYGRPRILGGAVFSNSCTTRR